MWRGYRACVFPKNLNFDGIQLKMYLKFIDSSEGIRFVLKGCDV